MFVKEKPLEVEKILFFLNEIGIEVIEKELGDTFLLGLSLGSNCIYIDYEKLLYPGLPFLEWLGLTLGKERAAKEGKEAFPVMIKWLRE
jgi:hypothetical protein